jgi:hypothetical protein
MLCAPNAGGQMNTPDELHEMFKLLGVDPHVITEEMLIEVEKELKGMSTLEMACNAMLSLVDSLHGAAELIEQATKDSTDELALVTQALQVLDHLVGPGYQACVIRRQILITSRAAQN